MNKVKVFGVWVLMWICDMIPWVSGWTIALITWIYDKLISSIKEALHANTFKELFSLDIAWMRRRTNWLFLVLVFGWIFLSVIVLSWIVENQINTNPELIWGFFLWLVIWSIVLLLQREKIVWSKRIIALLIGAVIAYFVWKIPLSSADPSAIYILFSAWIAICAMILPWISWSFLLLVLWMYKPLLWAINDKNIVFLWLFAVWAVLWLALFSRLISFVLKKYRGRTMWLLIWFMIWSLPVLWPWQSWMESDSEEKWEMQLLLPWEYNKTGTEIPVWILFLLWLFIWYRVFNKFEQSN